MLNAITGGASYLSLAYDNTEPFVKTKRQGNLVSVDDGRTAKSFSATKINQTEQTVVLQTDTFWADRHSPNNTNSNIAQRPQGKAQAAPALKRTDITLPISTDFWAQRHST
jgi:hypothetical protein